MAWTAEKVKAMRESNPAKATERDGRESAGHAHQDTDGDYAESECCHR